MKKRSLSTRTVIYIAVLAALATLIMFFEFPVLPTAPFLKVDFSDVITIIGGITFGPLAGTLIAFVRTIVNWLIKGSGVIGLIGNMAGFFGSVAIMLPMVLIKSKSRLFKIIISIISLTIVASLINYFILMPLYMALINMKINMSLLKYVLTIIVPFNLIKGVLVTGVSWIIYVRLASFLKRKNFQ
ncbi:ECF transporter S component [Companilactobacillus sp. DQM5]|uniref:ECF transporter S component n=1 Tax=Companilactobacillus sp. DQM5 TaxID=3463359 RepID=UPI00405819B0